MRPNFESVRCVRCGEWVDIVPLGVLSDITESFYHGLSENGVEFKKVSWFRFRGGHSTILAMLHPRMVLVSSTAVYSTIIQAEQIQTNSNHSSFSSSDGPCIVESDID